MKLVVGNSYGLEAEQQQLSMYKYKSESVVKSHHKLIRSIMQQSNLQLDQTKHLNYLLMLTQRNWQR